MVVYMVSRTIGKNKFSIWIPMLIATVAIIIYLVFKNNNIDSKIENLKEIYLKKDTNLKKDILLKNKTAWNDNLEKLKKEIYFKLY